MYVMYMYVCHVCMYVYVCTAYSCMYSNMYHHKIEVFRPCGVWIIIEWIPILSALLNGGINSSRVPVNTKHHTTIVYRKWRPHFWAQNRIITILVVFISGSHREVALLGLEFIGVWFICTKYIIFFMCLIICTLHTLLPHITILPA